MDQPNGGDQLDQAIANAGAVNMIDIPLNLGPGRPARVIVPIDITAIEMIGLIDYIASAHGLQASIASSVPASRILVPRA